MEEEKSKHPLYQILPAEVAENMPVSLPECSTIQFLNDSLPTCDSTNAATILSRTKVGIHHQIETLKKTKPFKKKSGLSQKERRIVGLYRLPIFSISYSDALPMLRLWEDYMYRFLNLNHMQNKQWYNPKTGHLWEAMNVTLMKADYHGALLKVVNSKCNSLVGLQGIVIFDTKFTFVIVCKDNMSRTIPKQSCIFEVYLKKYKFKVFGKYFCIRSNERSSKKIKTSLIPIL